MRLYLFSTPRSSASIDPSLLLYGTATTESAAGATLWWRSPSGQDSLTLSETNGEDFGPLPIPLAEGDNWIHLVLQQDGRVAARRLHVVHHAGLYLGIPELSTEFLETGRAEGLQAKLETSETGTTVEMVDALESSTYPALPALLLDDGTLPDSLAGDRLYTGEFTLTSEGEPVILRARMVTAAGTFFSPASYLFASDPVAPADLDAALITFAGASDLFRELFATLDQAAARDSVRNWLLEQPNVAVVGVGDQDTTVVYEDVLGITYVLAHEPAGTLGGGGGKIPVMGISPFAGQDPKLAQWDPLFRLEPIFASDTSRFHTKWWYDLGHPNDTNLILDPNRISAKLPAFSEWEGKKLVNIYTHGGTFGWGQDPVVVNFDPPKRNKPLTGTRGIALSTGIAVTPSPEVTTLLKMMFREKILGKDFGSTHPPALIYSDPDSGRIGYVAITPDYIRQFVPAAALSGSLVMNIACRTLWPAQRTDGPTWWEVFQEKGADAMVGFPDYVQIEYGALMDSLIVVDLLRGNTLGHAIDTAIHVAANQFSSLTTQNGRCDLNNICLEFRGDTSWTLLSRLWVAGSHAEGQLGLSLTAPQVDSFHSGPRIPGLEKVAAGGFHSLALDSAGRVWSWGRNAQGQLGDGSTVSRSQPAIVPGVSRIASICADKNGRQTTSQDHGISMALDSSGTVYEWGEGLLSPHVVAFPAEAATIQQISCGRQHKMALDANGTVYTWGSNSHGQLSDINDPDRTFPDSVKSIAEVRFIAAGERNSYAIRSDGSVWAWGSNAQGELGVQLGGFTGIPQRITALDNADIIKVSGGEDHALALSSTGTVWAWGTNTSGELGLFSTTSRERPQSLSTQRGNFKDIVDISAGAGISLASDKNGNVFGWGSNSHGQLGLSTTSVMSRAAPIAFPVRGWSIAAGSFHVLIAE